MFRNFKWSFTPRGWCRLARNFGKTRFRRFATFDFLMPIFLLEKGFGGRFFISKKVRFWRGYDFLIRVGRCVVKSYCPNCPYFWGDFLGDGVNTSICVETLDLAPKLTSTIWFFDVLILWSYNMMMMWYHDIEMRKNCVSSGVPENRRVALLI